MAEFVDLTDLLNEFNLTGMPLGTSSIPGISLQQDSEGQSRRS